MNLVDYKHLKTKTTKLIKFLNCNLRTKWYDKFKMSLEVNFSLCIDQVWLFYVIICIGFHFNVKKVNLIKKSLKHSHTFAVNFNKYQYMHTQWRYNRAFYYYLYHIHKKLYQSNSVFFKTGLAFFTSSHCWTKALQRYTKRFLIYPLWAQFQNTIQKLIM